MKRMTMRSPTPPARSVFFTVSWPRVGLTSLACTVVISEGRAPDLIDWARDWASARPPERPEIWV